jgi:transcriptional regulator with XRE-family HTH domain
MTIQPMGSTGSVPEWDLKDRLRKAREFAGMEQTEFAARTGISRGTISAAENGHTMPQRSNLNLWALATGVPLEWLTTGCTPRDLNPEPTDSGSGQVIPIFPQRLRLGAA